MPKQKSAKKQIKKEKSRNKLNKTDKKKYVKILVMLVVILGILNLLVFSIFLEKAPTITKINNITEKDIGKSLTVQGNLVQLNQFSKVAIGKVQDETGDIEIICNCQLEKYKGAEIKVLGKIEKYETRLQINAEKINAAV